jgi:hypothetical protein
MPDAPRTNISFDNDIDLDCDKAAGFSVDPKKMEKRVGYVLSLDGFGVGDDEGTGGLVKDLYLNTPYHSAWPMQPEFNAAKSAISTEMNSKQKGNPAWMITVCGVIKQFTWKGGVCDPVIVEFYCSQQNAILMKQRQNISLPHTKVQKLVWWIVDFDQETKRWFEQCYPVDETGIIGHVTGRYQPVLDVHMVAERVSDNIDMNVYYTKIGIVPQGTGTFGVTFAASPQQKVVKTWGLQLGDGSSV